MASPLLHTPTVLLLIINSSILARIGRNVSRRLDQSRQTWRNRPLYPPQDKPCKVMPGNHIAVEGFQTHGPSHPIPSRLNRKTQTETETANLSARRKDRLTIRPRPALDALVMLCPGPGWLKCRYSWQSSQGPFARPFSSWSTFSISPTYFGLTRPGTSALMSSSDTWLFLLAWLHPSASCRDISYPRAAMAVLATHRLLC